MSVFRVSWRDPQFEQELRALLDTGVPLDVAIWILWTDGRWGLMTLSASVGAVCDLSPREDKKMVVKVTFDVPRGRPAT